MNLTASATENRKRLVALIQPSSIAVIHSNDIMPTNADGVMHFRQNNDMYWLTGINQDETTLLLFPQHPDPRFREILFVKQVDESFVKWHGRRLSLEEASAVSGIGNVKWHHEFSALFYSMAVYAEHIYLNAIEHPRAENMVQTRDDRFAQWCKLKFPLHTYKRLAPVLGRLRTEKNAFEIQQLQVACDITGKGFRRVLQFIKPGVKEKQVEAEMIHEYLQHDATWAGYEPIVASGANSCILHYITNHNVCKDGDILLIDAAASYGLYNADLTRTIPVNGRYSPRQKEVYNAVLRVHKGMKEFTKAGTLLDELQRYASELLLKELTDLKLVSLDDIKARGEADVLNEYCYHGFSHFLGLDVHDVGNRYESLPANAVITVEPGIYISKEQIGVRIENNVLVTEKGTTDLMAGIPIEVEEIEEIMNSIK